MTKTVYIDVLFFENFILDFLCLYMTAFVMASKLYIKKAVLSSAVGSFYMCSLCIFDFYFLKSAIIKGFVICFMIFIAFGIKKLKILFKYTAVFVFINLSLGGCIYFFCTIFDGSMENGVFYIQPGVVSLILGGVALFMTGRFFVMLFKKNISFDGNKKELTLFYRNKKMKLNTLLDTGNTLVDPITGKSVVVVSPKKIKKLVSEEKISSIKNFRLIPCRTVTDKYEVLYGFKPDKFLYNDKELDVVVAIAKCEFENDCDAVINPVSLVD